MGLVRFGAEYKSAACARARHLLQVVLVSVVVGSVPIEALAGNFGVSPTNVGFGNEFVGGTRSVTVEVTNISAISQTLGMAGGAPSDPTNFGASQGCAGVTLAPGASCPINYSFHPASAGAKSAVSSFSINGESFQVVLSGVGVGAFMAAPLSLDFGNVVPGASASLTVFVFNISDVAQTLSMAGGGPSDSANFSGAQNCQGSTLQPQASCHITYEFHPVSPGRKSASTTFSINSQPFSVEFVGNGFVDDGIFADGFE